MKGKNLRGRMPRTRQIVPAGHVILSMPRSLSEQPGISIIDGLGASTRNQRRLAAKADRKRGKVT